MRHSAFHFLFSIFLLSSTIFIEPQQIELAGKHPPHIALVSEVGMSDGTPESLCPADGVPYTENIIAHVKNIGANYWSLWNWHNIHADHVINYYRQCPAGINDLNRVIGYRIRPSWIWTIGEPPHSTLIVALSNDGISGVPGILRLTLLDQDNNPISESKLEAGHPIPHQVRLAPLELPAGIGWEGMRLKAELYVKGVNHPLRWACRESVTPDGSLILKKNMN